MKKMLSAAIVALSVASVTARANVVTGKIWENAVADVGTDGSLANAVTLAGVRAADVTFSVNSPLAFDSRGPGGAAAFYTVGSFLGTGGATITGGLSEAGNTLDNTFFYLTGNVTMVNGQSFNVNHDDGLQLKIGGVLVVDVPGPTAPANTPYTWTGLSGTYSFELAYAENSGAPGVLKTDLPLSAVPDGGSTSLLLGVGMLGLAWVRRSVKG